MDKNKKLNEQRTRRRHHVRKPLRGTPDRPRLSVERTLKHFACQLIDDTAGRTICAASTRQADLKGSIQNGGNCDAAAAVGKKLAELAQAAGVTAVRLDRGHNRYHGRVKAFADAAREGGLQF
ncbi:50S ribosomal protein L18 [Candidatus Laterigemmans baculatus]|uniref:50S ribosomal protein L18 n=1 Tax=Candidatus Laterigemmans baculatus TaxID=2770505 RepID=UPI0013DC9A78|nr:50S ribosomal protein L18 [Candidatus Laterigemmans baculatus]